MSSLQDDLHNFLLLVPLAAERRDGLPLSEAAELIGGKPNDVIAMVSRAIAVGMPDGSPDELVDIYIEEGRLFVHSQLSFHTPPRLTSDEVIALSLALGRVEELQDTRIGTVTKSLRKKLLGVATERAERVSSSLNIALEKKPKFFDLIEESIAEGTMLFGGYNTATRDSFRVRVIRPNKLWERHGHWYVIADEKMFRLDRFSDLVTFDSDNPEHLALLDALPPEQPAARNARIVVDDRSFSITIRSMEALMRWMLTENAKIEDAPEVKADLKRQLSELLERYA